MPMDKKIKKPTRTLRFPGTNSGGGSSTAGSTGRTTRTSPVNKLVKVASKKITGGRKADKVVTPAGGRKAKITHYRGMKEGQDGYGVPKFTGLNKTKTKNINAGKNKNKAGVVIIKRKK
jgi:hypothetical protein